MYHRWNYTNPLAPEAPDYSIYTGLTAKMTLMADDGAETGRASRS